MNCRNWAAAPVRGKAHPAGTGERGFTCREDTCVRGSGELEGHSCSGGSRQPWGDRGCPFSCSAAHLRKAFRQRPLPPAPGTAGHQPVAPVLHLNAEKVVENQMPTAGDHVPPRLLIGAGNPEIYVKSFILKLRKKFLLKAHTVQTQPKILWNLGNCHFVGAYVGWLPRAF